MASSKTNTITFILKEKIFYGKVKTKKNMFHRNDWDNAS